jgi:hypothetical protein
VRYQALALQGLAGMRTKESFKTLLALWLERPVHMRDSRMQMFLNFHDTLELSAGLFPDLLKFADVDANREVVYGLLEQLVRKGLVKPKTYAYLKPALLRETAWYLSQKQVEEEEKRSIRKNGGPYAYTDYYGGYYGGGTEAAAVIERNFGLLSPFYAKDREVQALFERAIRYGDKQTQLVAYSFYLLNNIPFPQEKLKPLSEDDQTRYLLFERLARLDKLRPYAAWFADTTALARSYIMQNAEGRNIDSIRFISKHKTVLQNKAATLFFFDIKQKDDTDWGLASAILPRDFSYLTKENSRADNGGANLDYYESYLYGPQMQIMGELAGKEKEEYIRKKIGEIRFANRERYVSETDNGRVLYNNY